MAKKIAIVGAGWMAAYHVAGFRAAGADVVAIVDKNAAAAKEASQKYGVDKTFGETKDLYGAIKDLDAVSIITPERLPSSPGHGGASRRQARLLREASGPERRRSRADGRGRQEGRQDPDVQLQQPRPSRVLCDEGVFQQRRGRPRQFGAGHLDPPERHPRLRRLVHDQEAFRRRPAHRPAPHGRPRPALHGLSRAPVRAGPDLHRFHRQQGVQGPLGHSGREGRRHRRRSVGPCAS